MENNDQWGLAIGLTTLSIAITIWITGRLIDHNSFELYFTINTLVLAVIVLPLSIAYVYHRKKDHQSG